MKALKALYISCRKGFSVLPKETTKMCSRTMFNLSAIGRHALALYLMSFFREIQK